MFIIYVVLQYIVRYCSRTKLSLNCYENIIKNYSIIIKIKSVPVDGVYLDPAVCSTSRD